LKKAVAAEPPVDLENWNLILPPVMW